MSENFESIGRRPPAYALSVACQPRIVTRLFYPERVDRVAAEDEAEAS